MPLVPIIYAQAVRGMLAIGTADFDLQRLVWRRARCRRTRRIGVRQATPGMA